MRQIVRALFILISMTSNNALSKTEKTELVQIEGYQFELKQDGVGRASLEAAPEEEKGISYHSVTLNYTLKQDNIVESPTLLESLNKNAEEKCHELRGTGESEIISKTRTVSPWKITGVFICALK